MSNSSDLPDLPDLPDVIPVFPLPNVVLFPHIQLPLHIFEPRYRMMVHDAGENSPSLIGMALLKGVSSREEYEGNPGIYPIGCVGEMVRMVPQPDGRSNILLQGMYAYEIQEEIVTKPYRQARVSWRHMPKIGLPEGRRQELGGLLKRYLPENDNVEKFLADTSIEDDFFINFFSFHLGLLPIEKQSLLEVVGLPERAEQLQDILEFKLAENTMGKDGPNKPRMH